MPPENVELWLVLRLKEVNGQELKLEICVLIHPAPRLRAPAYASFGLSVTCKKSCGHRVTPGNPKSEDSLLDTVSESVVPHFESVLCKLNSGGWGAKVYPSYCGRNE